MGRRAVNSKIFTVRYALRFAFLLGCKTANSKIDVESLAAYSITRIEPMIGRRVKDVKQAILWNKSRTMRGPKRVKSTEPE